MPNSESAHPAELVETAVSASKADACIAILEERSGVNLRWAGNAVITNGQTRDRAMTVISIDARSDGYGVGTISRSVASSDDVRTLVGAADAASRAGRPVDESSPLVDPYESPDPWEAEVCVTGADVFARLSAQLHAAFQRFRRERRLLFGFAEHELKSTFLTTSTGVRRRFDQADGRLEFTAKSRDSACSSWHGVYAPDFARIDLDGPFDAFERARVWSERNKELPAGRYETILPPPAVSDLMLCAYKQASLRDADDGRSAFSAPGGGSRIGERLCTLPLTLYSDPTYPGLECLPFAVVTSGNSSLQSVFDNGVRLRPTVWIDDGTLTNLVSTRAYRGKGCFEPRPLIGNLILDGAGTASLDDMVGSTERGLLLTSLWYIREVDPLTLLVTGTTRDGVYLVEDGAIVGTVNNFRFNESAVDLLRRVTEVGRMNIAMPRERADEFRRTAMPPLRIPDFCMSSVSAAS